jgi:16S rRNA (guanine966-N2)-methyltransferase
MRIIAGTLKHRTIPSPPDDTTRPTSDRGREALFHVLEHHVEFQGASVLDLCAGTGALAFEAISRGAHFATLVDTSADVCRQLRTVAEFLDISPLVQIIRADAREYLRYGRVSEHRIVFADPPYAQKACNSIASLLLSSGALAIEGLAAFEHGDQEHILELPEMQQIKNIELAQTTFSIMRRVSPLA